MKFKEAPAKKVEQKITDSDLLKSLLTDQSALFGAKKNLESAKKSNSSGQMAQLAINNIKKTISDLEKKISTTEEKLIAQLLDAVENETVPGSIERTVSKEVDSYQTLITNTGNELSVARSKKDIEKIKGLEDRKKTSEQKLKEAKLKLELLKKLPQQDQSKVA